MDVLIDLIIYIIKQMTKPSPSGAAPAGSQARARQAALARQAQATAQMTAPRARRSSAPGPGVRMPPTAWTQAAAIKPAQLIRPIAAAPAAKPVAPISGIGRAAPPRITAAGMRVPFLLGQVLEPPIALRNEDL